MISKLEKLEVSKNTHDYTRRTWGHDYSITQVTNEGMNVKMLGWGNGIQGGDYLIL